MALSRRVHSPSAAAAVVVLFCATAVASDLDEFKVKREAVFEFVRKPVVTRQGDRVSIAFETKGFCDVTVAIEDPSTGAGPARIVRHLASGVLGSNAPEPFQEDSMTQTIVWDGKDDQGRYVDDMDAVTVRVSLGLKARFERSLLWSPRKRPGDPKGATGQPTLMTTAPEGVYVFESAGPDHVRLFDHDGTYIRTVYPFPADRLRDAEGLKWHTFPQDGARLPLKWGLGQTTLLTSGDLSYGKAWPTSGGGSAATAIAIHGDELYLVNQRLNRLAIRGARVGIKAGPITGVFLSTKDAVPGREFIREFHCPPRSVAVSPDGKWLYLTGYNYNAYFRAYALHGVTRVPVNGDGPPEVFVGVLKRNTWGGGTDNAHFRMPSGVACDPKGRVYVTDWGNDRIQVFTPDAKHIKTIPVKRPARVRIHPKTGELYVFSWPISCDVFDHAEAVTTPSLTVLGPLENPERRAAYPLDLPSSGNTRIAEADVDFWTDPPTIWLARNQPISYRGWPAVKAGLLVLVPKGRTLEVKHDFLKTAQRKVLRLYGARHNRQRLFVSPATGLLYVGEHHHPAAIHAKSISELICIDPDTGRVRLVPMPFDAEDLAFDIQGRAYLRTLNTIARYDPETWREAPFDYGEERIRHGYHPLKMADVKSVVPAVGFSNSSSQMGGMCVSPTGRVAVTFHNPSKPVPLKGTKSVGAVNPRSHSPTLFPGRRRAGEIHVWDERGRMVYKDAFPGIGSMSGLNMDKDDNLYVLSAACRLYDGTPHFNDTTCTLIKVKPGKAKVLSNKAEIPLVGSQRPTRPPDLMKGDLGRAWAVGAEWMYGGVAMDAKMMSSASRDCHCQATSRPALDYFARSFLPEVDRCSVAVVDSGGNTIMRIGRNGNVDDGRPLLLEGGPLHPRPIGGDEVALFWANHVATHTDRRLFIADQGNARILSVKLDYHTTERVALKDMPDGAATATSRRGKP